MGTYKKEQVIDYFNILNDIFEEKICVYDDKLSPIKNLKENVHDEVNFNLTWDSFVSGRIQIAKEKEFKETMEKNKTRMLDLDIDSDYVFYNNQTYIMYKVNYYCFVYKDDKFIFGY
jgi:hypothetical protein